MKLAELFPEGGRGIIATANTQGVINQAVFAVPHVINEETLAWGFSEGRSLLNLRENPHASYLYLAPTRGYSGWRLSLTMKKEEQEGEVLESIRAGARNAAGPQAGAALRAVVYFTVDEVRPLM
ncbi:hypothetical protein GMLC_36630 [Geomonas limicola]|uniref:Pyridoxamine 5'-phosphate oxidase putative domain-containing protein n=1 Tax=Geomonas limicola TaxID=2740186 RepID=A0A6V8NE40_9BACT|nr:pyridoxamine 5'-phosphate oxidase family protein [Geomonas limicola]GFO70084.1 hypothetical protein GMLC_36630 [Geomonas limicola]